MARDDLDGPEFEDTYTDALAKIIESKREDKPLPDAPEPEQPGKVLDFMAALTESVQQATAPPRGCYVVSSRLSEFFGIDELASLGTFEDLED
ncbi:hypothetical protein ABZT06_49315, partial [Streptomyces sp. NPDC005483]